MASLEEIASRFPKAIEELQRSNERAAEDARVSQNRELHDLRKAVRESTDKRSREHNDNKEKLKRLNENIREAAKKEEELAKTSAGQAMALKKQLEESGKVAEDNKEFQKLSYQARKADYKQRLADATSPAAKKEIREEARKDAKENGSRLDKIAAGVGGLFEIGKKGLKTAALGGLAILSTLAIGAFMIALGKFLQSDTFKKITKFIQETILPKVMEFWEFLKDNWKEIGVLLGAALAAFVVVKAVMIGAKIVKTIQAIGVAFAAVKAFFASTMLPAVTAMMIPLLPFIVIGAAISLALYSLKEAFDDARKTFEETGSIGEALKAGISKFMGTLLGFIPEMVLKLVGWVAGLFGFDDFKKKVNAIDPIEFISKHISDMITKLVDFVKLLFKDPVGAIKELVKGFIDVITDFAGFVYKKAIKPIIDWVGGLFGVEDASGQMEGFVGKKLDKIINFAKEIYNEYIKPIVDWVTGIFKKFGSVDAMAKFEAAGEFISNLTKRILKSILPNPNFASFKIPEVNIPLLGKVGGGSINLNPIPDSVYKFAGIDPKTGETIPEPPEPLTTAAAKIGSDAVIQQMTDSAAAAVKRDASSSAAAGGGGPTNIVDARQSSSVTTTGPTGRAPLKNERYAGLPGVVSGFG